MGGLEILAGGPGLCRTEIVKLKELPNERLEGSWDALWLGIRTFFGCKLGVVGPQGKGKLMKSQKTKS